MTRSVFPVEHTDYTQQNMFFDKEPNVNRNDVVKFSKFTDFIEQQQGFFWRPSEIDCSKDRVDFMNMEPHEKHIFISNIKYQSLLDSVQGRAPTMIFGQIVSLPELETWLTTWAFSETIHEQSYTHIIRNVFKDPTEIFDTVLDVPEIVDRATAVTKEYDKLYSMVNAYNNAYGGIVPFSLYDIKTQLFKCMVNVYFLEALRFYGSFVSTFSFGKRGVMEGQSKIMQLIARDEYLHQGSTHFMITRWLLGLDDPEMTIIARENTDYVMKIAEEICEQEMLWADYLFQYGSIIGLNANILKNYLMWLTDERTKQLLVPKHNGRQVDFGYSQIYNVKENPITWVNEFLMSDNVQVAPQEAEISTYMVGQVNTHVDESFLDDLEL